METPQSPVNAVPQLGSLSSSTQLRLRSALRSTGRIYLDSSAEEVALHSLSVESQNQTEKEVADWCAVIEGFVSEIGTEKPLNKTRSLFKYYFDRMGLSVAQEFTNSIMDGDVVEVFGTDGRRLFFNPELFDYSSYPPDVMFSAPFWRLYRRDAAITELIQMHAMKVFTGQITTPFKPDIPVHVVTETESLHRYSSEVEIKLFAPIYLGRGIVGGAALEKFRLLLS